MSNRYRTVLQLIFNYYVLKVITLMSGNDSELPMTQMYFCPFIWCFPSHIILSHLYSWWNDFFHSMLNCSFFLSLSLCMLYKGLQRRCWSFLLSPFFEVDYIGQSNKSSFLNNSHPLHICVCYFVISLLSFFPFKEKYWQILFSEEVSPASMIKR